MTNTKSNINPALNPSLANIQQGLRPIGMKHSADNLTTYYVFSSGTWRRDIGQGHSHTERRDRRIARKERRNESQSK